MDALANMDAIIASGEAWHVGFGPHASQYVFSTREDAEAMLAHVSLVGSGCSVRSQSEINAYIDSINKTKEA